MSSRSRIETMNAEMKSARGNSLLGPRREIYLFVNYSCDSCIQRVKLFQIKLAKDLHALYYEARIQIELAKDLHA